MTIIKKRENRLGQALYLLLMENEERFRVQRKGLRPRTDIEILAILTRLKPDSKGLKSMLSGRLTVNNYRQKMNSGNYFHAPIWPPSFRYNKNGERVSGKSGVRRLTANQQSAIIGELAEKQAKYRQEQGEDFDAQEASEMVVVREVPSPQNT